MISAWMVTVEAGCRLVEDQKLRLADQGAMAIITRCAMPPRRIRVDIVVRGARARECKRGEGRRWPFLWRLRRASRHGEACGVGELPADSEDWIECGARITENHADTGAAQLRIPVSSRSDIDAFEADGAGLRMKVGGCRPSIDSATSDLPDPVSPTTAVMTPAFSA